MDREKLVLEAFELSREIGYQRFLAENFHRADPVLTALKPEERKAFLRNWWDAARDRMYEGYRELVAGYGVSQLLDMRDAYIDTLDALGLSLWRRERAADERERFQQVLKGELKTEEKPQQQAKDQGRERE